jgi:hypothetical protein|tara:strand:- start:553 stop:681 length:129 start_codon:yes stop_codon:yes gene_type:complete
MEDWGWADLKIVLPFISFNARWVPEEVQTGFIEDDIKITNEK